MSDLIERLRGSGAVPVTVMTKTLCNEAADRIEELEAKVQAQSEYIMTANRVNNNLKKQVEEG